MLDHIHFSFREIMIGGQSFAVVVVTVDGLPFSFVFGVGLDGSLPIQMTLPGMER